MSKKKLHRICEDYVSCDVVHKKCNLVRCNNDYIQDGREKLMLRSVILIDTVKRDAHISQLTCALIHSLTYDHS